MNVKASPRWSFFAQVTVIASLACPTAVATAQTHRAGRADEQLLPYGVDGFAIPSSVPNNETSPRVVQLLAEALAAKPATPRRVALVRDLGRCKLAAALPHVVAAATDPDAAVRAEAARSIAALDDPSAAATVHKLLGDADTRVRREAVRAGAALDDQAVITGGLNHQDETVFAAACAFAATPEHAATIAARLPSLPPRARLAAIRALGRQRATAHAQVVAAQSSSTDLALAIAAMEALGQMRAASEVAAVHALLSHPHPTARRAAVTALGGTAKADEQVLVARRMLADADLTVREAAARLLVANPAADAVPLLVQQLSAGYPPLRDAARDALVSSAAVAMTSVVDAGSTLLNHPDPRRREDGSFILGRIRSDAALQRHIELLGDPDWGVVGQAAQSLGHIGRREAGPQLARLAAQPARAGDAGPTAAARADAIGSAFIACGRLRHQPIVNLAKPIIADKVSSPRAVRVPAIWAAGAAADAADADLANRLLSVYHDNSPYEVEAARFEAAKGLGNMRYTPALDVMRQQGKENPLPTLRWIAHRVADRLAGAAEPTPYTPPSVPYVADTSIRELRP